MACYIACMRAYTDSEIRKVLERTQTIAIIGASPNPDRPSNRVGRFLADNGYRVIPVNPGQVGTELFGETVVGSLADIKLQVDMVDIFRRSEAVGPIVAEALKLNGLQTIWMQLGVINEDAARMAADAGIDVIMDRCPKIEYRRLMQM